MCILVLGHTGFLGSLLTKKIISEGHEVIGISRKGSGIDLRYSYIKNYLDDIDLVYHCAANIGDRVSPELFIDNVTMSYKVFEACFLAKKPVIYLSSCEIYGNGMDIRESDMVYDPPNMYAASKCACEDLLSQFSKLGLQYKVVRIFNPLSLHNHAQFMIPNWLKLIKEHKPLTTYGDPYFEGRDWVWQDDVIDGLWQAREWPDRTTAHLSSGRFTSNIEMAEILYKVAGMELRTVNVPHPKDHSGLLFQSGDPTLVNSLGWKAKTSIEEAMERIVAEWQST